MLGHAKLKAVLDEALNGVAEIYKSHLKAVILFGSYARGDYNNDSDIDIALLIDLDRKDLSAFRGELMAFSSELDLKHDVLTSFRCIPVAEYERWKETLPFYANIEREGVKIA